MIASVTGHRPDKLGFEYDLKGPTTLRISGELIKWLKQHSPSKVISGMALGVDQIWAICAIKLDIPVIAAIPCANQENRWPEASKKLYRKIMSHPSVIPHYVDSGAYAAYKMQQRNIWMVENSDVVVAVWDGSKGGTGNCVAFAESVGKKIFIFDPKKNRWAHE